MSARLEQENWRDFLSQLNTLIEYYDSRIGQQNKDSISRIKQIIGEKKCNKNK